MKRIIYSMLLGLASYGVSADDPSISSSARNIFPVPQKLVFSLKFDDTDQAGNNCQEVYGTVTLNKVGRHNVDKILFDRPGNRNQKECGRIAMEYMFTSPPLAPDDLLEFTVEFRDRDDGPFDLDEKLCEGDLKMIAGQTISSGKCIDINVSLTPFYEEHG